jgi:hypothetical protein
MIFFGLLPMFLSYFLTIAIPVVCSAAEKNIFGVNEALYGLMIRRKSSVDSLEKKELII